MPSNINNRGHSEDDSDERLINSSLSLAKPSNRAGIQTDEDFDVTSLHETQEAIKKKLLLAKMDSQYMDDDDDVDSEVKFEKLSTKGRRNPTKLAEMNSASNMSQTSSFQRGEKRRGISRRFASTMNSRKGLDTGSQMDTSSNYSDDNSDTQSQLTSDSGADRSTLDDEVAFTHQDDFVQLNNLISQFNMCGFPVLIFDNYATIEYLNREAEDLFGVFSFSVLGEHVSELFLEDSVCEVQQVIEDFTGKPIFNNSDGASVTSISKEVGAEELKKRKDTLMKIRILKGKATILKTFFSVKTRFITIQKLGVEHFVAYMEVIQDSIEEKKEMALRKVYEAITDLSVIPIISISQQGIIQTFNTACTATFGYLKKDVLGKNVKMLCNEKDRQKHDYYLQRYLKTGEKRVVDKTRFLKAKTKKAKSIKIELRVSEIIDVGSSSSSFVGFIRDVKNMVTKEEQLTRLADKIFPKNVAQRISMGQQVIDIFEMCSVLFCDIVGFTKMSNGKRPEEVVSILHEIFGSFDDVCTAFQLEKIKTIGDCYFLASGVPKFVPEHADNIVKGGLAMIRVIQQFCKKETTVDLKVRIGIHSSCDIIAGVVGKTKQTYDLFGKGIEVAEIVESTGKTNQVQISNSTYQLLQSEKLKSLFSVHYEEKEELLLEKVGKVVIPERTWITDLQ
ncbi:predicted protein [Naegleria gruberi]|uniref:Predicted protein n=1 Tax=Naegleria gruberi TaxID=5762 RepID=D2VBQ0_NAEGR|nr:uncharacterized protein NAEGRDRAFT_66293 [Naegleria gruberi]EFC45834.1 predicted protein [Naegleria gruberi]|eukprot:XP_002678578.1 predicted protein [Naegleria gruberi strain NEG-M]